MSFGDMQEHGECERCGDSHHTNSPTEIGFGLPAYLCFNCVRKFILYAPTTKEIQAWEKALAWKKGMKSLMKDPAGFGIRTTGDMVKTCEDHKQALLSYERAMSDVNAMAARFLANKEG